jgi:hypothetical protein
MNTSDRIARSEDGVLSGILFRFPPDFEPILRQMFLGGSLRWIDINGMGIQMHLFGRWGELCELAFREGNWSRIQQNIKMRHGV